MLAQNRLLKAEEESRRIGLKTAAESDVKSSLQAATMELSRYEAELKDACGAERQRGDSPVCQKSPRGDRGRPRVIGDY
jgi:hypothetical protein